MTALAAMLPTVGATAATAAPATAAWIGTSSALGSTLAGIEGASLAASAAAPAMSLSSLFSGGLTLASAGLSMFGGAQQSEGIWSQARAESRALESQAKDQESMARQEELRGQQEANSILENLNKTIASQRLAFSASGFDPVTGTADAVAKNTVKSADISLGTSRSDAVLRALNRRRQAQELIISRGAVMSKAVGDSRGALYSGIGSAAASLTDLGMRRISRG